MHAKRPRVPTAVGPGAFGCGGTTERSAVSTDRPATPTHHEDTEGIEIKRSKGKLSINLITALWEDDLLQPTNQKQRFDLETVPAKQSPSGRACLLLDLTKPRETRYIKQPKKNSGTATK